MKREEEYVMEEEMMEAEASVETETPEEGIHEASQEVWDADREAEIAALRLLYPAFDPTVHMKEPLFAGLVSGELRPTLRQVYELCHGEEILNAQVEKQVAERVTAAVELAVNEAVERTVTETEQRLLSHIRARGQRPQESGLHAAQGVRTHPAVGRLTKADREKLARRASRGETIRL